MNKLYLWAVAASSASCFAFVKASAGVSPVKEVSLSVSPAMVRVGAVPAKTWGELCKTEVFSDLTGLRIPSEFRGKLKSFYTVGDHMTAYRGSQRGTLVVTKFDPARELRVVWEPENGDHPMSERFLLKRKPSGTAIEYWERSSAVYEQAAREKIGGISRFASRFND
jgi:hypothetical protein